jgi:hypothetical protein
MARFLDAIFDLEVVILISPHPSLRDTFSPGGRRDMISYFNSALILLNYPDHHLKSANDEVS